MLVTTPATTEHEPRLGRAVRSRPACTKQPSARRSAHPAHAASLIASRTRDFTWDGHRGVAAIQVVPVAIVRSIPADSDAAAGTDGPSTVCEGRWDGRGVVERVGRTLYFCVGTVCEGRWDGRGVVGRVGRTLYFCGGGGRWVEFVSLWRWRAGFLAILAGRIRHCPPARLRHRVGGWVGWRAVCAHSCHGCPLGCRSRLQNASVCTAGSRHTCRSSRCCRRHC